MKRLFLLTLIAAGCLAMTSCTDDDNNSDNGTVSSALKGTFELTSLVVPTAQDYDNDGDTNTNLVLEGSCYNDSWISFHSNGTYDEGYSSSILNNGGLTLTCDTKVSAGTYTQNGNTVTTTRTSGEGSLNATYAFDATSHTLTRTDATGSYAGWNGVTSLFANLTGNMKFTFTKYTDNDTDNGNSDTDTDNTDAAATSQLIGNFNLSAYIVGLAQDLDHDGDSSTNLMTESSCYSSSKIEFKSDGTYSETAATSILTNGNIALECHTETTTGTWVRNGDVVTTRHTSGNVNVSTEYMFNSTTHTLTRTDASGDYPGFNAVTSLFMNLTGNINYTFTKS